MRRDTQIHRYAFQIEIYKWKTDSYRRGEWSASTEYNSNRDAEEAARRLAAGVADVTRVYIRRDDGVSWHIG